MWESWLSNGRFVFGEGGRRETEREGGRERGESGSEGGGREGGKVIYNHKQCEA